MRLPRPILSRGILVIIALTPTLPCISYPSEYLITADLFFYLITSSRAGDSGNGTGTASPKISGQRPLISENRPVFGSPGTGSVEETIRVEESRRNLFFFFVRTSSEEQASLRPKNRRGRTLGTEPFLRKNVNIPKSVDAGDGRRRDPLHLCHVITDKVSECGLVRSSLFNPFIEMRVAFLCRAKG